MAHYEQNDIAPCRACGVAPDYRKSSRDAYYLRCPECGIKTGTSTGGLDALVPKGFNVVFADGDRRNFDPANLVAVPRSAMATINSRGMKYHDAESLEACVRVAELEGAISRAQKSPRPCKRCGETFAPRFANQKTCDTCLGRWR